MRFDIQTQTGKGVGNAILGVVCGIAFYRISLHCTDCRTQKLGRVVQFQHDERALRLPGQRGELRQTFTLSRIAKKQIQHIFYLFQVGTDFLCQVVQQFALGYRLRAGIHQGFCLWHGATFRQGQQTLGLIVSPDIKVRTQHFFRLHGVLQKQQGGGDFKIQLLLLFCAQVRRRGCGI